MAREQDLEAVDGFFLRIGQQFRQRPTGDHLTVAQFLVVRKLYTHGPMAMGELAESLGVSFAAATGIVDRLSQAGLVHRRRSDVDRRVVWVELSPEGHAKMAEMRQARRHLLEAMMQPLDDDELHELVRLLGKVVEGVGERHG
ncbi:MAG: MarR family transcriptional regulator [Firmicutes bacterium]|nr:MarR family transcriptional regulator [Alicyclobacillaceae bacterium]MCL6497081.1 MarR family transcriptional regulator [Bacillota bacterium]